MEALWTLFLPRYDVLRQLLADGVIGEVRTVLADHGEAFGPDHRIFRPDLAGGPLLDLGTYPVALSTWVLGAPDTVHASAIDHSAGVHGEVAAVLTTRCTTRLRTSHGASPTAGPSRRCDR
jgi:predicted dehydrogenase